MSRSTGLIKEVSGISIEKPLALKNRFKPENINKIFNLENKVILKKTGFALSCSFGLSFPLNKLVGGLGLNASTPLGHSSNCFLGLSGHLNNKNILNSSNQYFLNQNSSSTSFKNNNSLKAISFSDFICKNGALESSQSLKSGFGFNTDNLIFSNAGRNKNAVISQKQERELAEILGGRVHWFSGATFYEKSDLSSSLFRVEAKTTFNKERIVIKVADILKIERESLIDDKIAMLSFKLQGEHFGIIKKSDIDSLLDSFKSKTRLIFIKQAKKVNKQITFNKNELNEVKFIEDENKVKCIPIFISENTEYYVLPIEFLVELQTVFEKKMSDTYAASKDN